MGRPNQCNPCCGNEGSGGSGGPAISDCEKVICVAFIDDNASSSSQNYSTFSQKMSLWRRAYPNRLLFVLEVRSRWDFGQRMHYPRNFEDWPKAFSLEAEYPKNPIGLISYIERDNGNTSVANQNNPWERIKAIVNHYGGDVLQLFNSSREVAIFIDNSGSMTAGQVAATVEKLKQDAINDQKIITQTIINEHEDVICPFVQSSCNTGQYSQQLISICSDPQFEARGGDFFTIV
jgi:hypothetical protein